MGPIIELKWKRPKSSDFPKHWYTFKAKDLDSDGLVDYHVEDLSEARSQEALEWFVEHFCREEPICNACEISNDLKAQKDALTFLWKPIVQQKMVLVCYKSGSDEIVGLNMNYVKSKDDDFFVDVYKQFTIEKNIRYFTTLFLLFDDYDLCESYGVDAYLGSAGLLVMPKYRGRKIGEHLLNARRNICNHFEIKLTSAVFTSDITNRIADKVGFKLDKFLSYDEIRDKHPELGLNKVKSVALTLKSILF